MWYIFNMYILSVKFKSGETYPLKTCYFSIIKTFNIFPFFLLSPKY